MTLTQSQSLDFGQPCPDFALPDAAGRMFARDDLARPGGFVVAFICNHCPYVVRQMDALAADFKALAKAGIGGVCIMSNDWTAYPADAPDRMAAFAKRHGLTAPYLVDETQDVARAMGAICTPDLFGYGPGGVLRYRGRQQELRAAMAVIAAGGAVPDQTPGMGCSIKWR